MNWWVQTGEESNPRWRAMSDLFSNEYFTRAWVIQEIALGQRTEIYLGGTYIPWLIFSQYVYSSRLPPELIYYRILLSRYWIPYN